MEERESTPTQSRVFKATRAEVSFPLLNFKTHVSFRSNINHNLTLEEKALSQTTNDVDFSYKEVSDLSDATEDV